MTNEVKEYPRVSKRVKAVIIDSIIIIILMVVTSQIFMQFNNVPDFVRVIAFIFIFGLYDPIFTSSFGGTIGHMIIGIRVKREKNETQNIILPLAILRFVLKSTLGWISLLTVMSNEKGKAIHDMAVKSVVINYD